MSMWADSVSGRLVIKCYPLKIKSLLTYVLNEQTNEVIKNYRKAGKSSVDGS